MKLYIAYIKLLSLLYLCNAYSIANNTVTEDDTLIKRGLNTCSPTILSFDRSITFNKWNAGEGHKLYDCEVLKEDTIIACKVDYPILHDGAVIFRVDRSRNGNCNYDTCMNGTRQTILYKHANGVIRDTKIDAKHNYVKNYHFCERITYKGKTCDINYQIKDYKYKDNGAKDIASTITWFCKLTKYC